MVKYLKQSQLGRDINTIENPYKEEEKFLFVREEHLGKFGESWEYNISNWNVKDDVLSIKLFNKEIDECTSANLLFFKDVWYDITGITIEYLTFNNNNDNKRLNIYIFNLEKIDAYKED